jgi:peptidoglycan/LPS O-acetylase OafA/YrhL
LFASTSLPASQKLNGPDHLRALAILLVFAFHYRIFKHPKWLDDAASFGWTGVDLFFVLSGYLIASQLFNTIKAGNTISFRVFFLKRFFRIIPAYLAVLALYFLIPAFREKEALPPLWKFLTFTQNFGLDLFHNGTFSHAWSLCIEEQFYLILPLMVIFFVNIKAGRRAFYLLPALLITGVVLRIFSWNTLVEPMADTDEFALVWYQYIYYPTYNRLDGLLVGVAIAGLFSFLPVLKNRITQYGNWLLIGGLALLTLAYFICEDSFSYTASIWGFPIVAIGYGVLLMAALSKSCILYRFHSRISSGIAGLSYSVYLSHKGIIHLTQQGFVKLGVEANSNLVFISCILCSFLAAAVLRYMVEKPFLRLRDQIIERNKTKE